MKLHPEEGLQLGRPTIRLDELTIDSRAGAPITHPRKTVIPRTPYPYPGYFEGKGRQPHARKPLLFIRGQLPSFSPPTGEAVA